MITLLTIIHVAVSVFLILVVLLQQGKGQDFAGTFGGGGSQASFGARSAATVLHRLTTVSAVMFMVTSMSLTILISQPATSSVIRGDAVQIGTQPEDGEPIDDVDAVPEAGDAEPATGPAPEGEPAPEN